MNMRGESWQIWRGIRKDFFASLNFFHENYKDYYSCGITKIPLLNFRKRNHSNLIFD